MAIHNHDLDVAVALRLARVDRPRHVLARVPKDAQVLPVRVLQLRKHVLGRSVSVGTSLQVTNLYDVLVGATLLGQRLSLRAFSRRYTSYSSPQHR